jgi:hypothetical protein
MGSRISVGKAGLVLGAVVGGWHLCWSILVALGWAQRFVDFVFWVHFIKPIYVIEPFVLMRAAILLAVTAAFGFVIGAVFAWLWNAVHKARRAVL